MLPLFKSHESTTQLKLHLEKSFTTNMILRDEVKIMKTTDIENALVMK